MIKNILVVDDNEKSRKLLSDILTYYNYQVITAASGEEGVKMAKLHKPGLIFMEFRCRGWMVSRQ